ncbi:MAG: response regulator [Desulfobacteraceae bacterium]|nr:response regulator [Desulfobacteraceae bacterium]
MVADVSANSERILVVDDDESICKMLQSGLNHYNFESMTASRPGEALEILKKTPVGVVITDIRMPEMSGIELAEIVRKKYKADVIIMTGYVEDFNYEDIVQQGAADFIQKPVRIAEFIARLKRVLAERSRRLELKRALNDIKVNFQRFQRAMEGFVQAISVAVEMRDPYTAGHQQRVADLAVAVAKQMGLSPDEIYGLRMASVIHDLGKITVPDGILSKPGKLLPLEYELIKGHVQAGFNILRRIEFPWPLAEIIRQHHERLDGSGYPQGLKGEDILLPARILSVADVFETMASHRPYRPSLGLERALNEIKNNSGKLYDSEVVRICIDLVENNYFQFDDSFASDATLFENVFS